MGAPRVTYEAPKIEKDDSFEKYLEYQKDRETKLEERAQKEREDKEGCDKEDESEEESEEDESEEDESDDDESNNAHERWGGRDIHKCESFDPSPILATSDLLGFAPSENLTLFHPLLRQLSRPPQKCVWEGSLGVLEETGNRFEHFHSALEGHQSAAIG